jgi:3-dehydrosphinganine reductase
MNKKDFFMNKNILITGGSSGIGLALAQKLSTMGAVIWLVARDEFKLASAIDSLPPASRGGIFSTDVSQIDQVNALAERWDKKDTIDILINSAGIAYPGTFDNLSLDTFHQLMEINYFGTINIIKFLFPYLSNQAHIVNIASMAAVLGVYGYSAYGASKYAVRGFTDVLRSELILTEKKVSLVFPPDTETPQLAFENQFKPAITKKIAGNAGALSAEKVADEIINGIFKNKYIIIPGLESKLIYLAVNLFGRKIYPIMDWMVRSAAKKID